MALPRWLQFFTEAHYAEEHVHNKERWFGISADQGGEDWALQETLAPFIATTDANVWGTAGTDPAKVFGTADTPIFVGGKYFDFHRVLIVANTSASLYKLRFIWGTGTVAEGVAAGQYSEFMFIRDIASIQRKILEVMSPKIAVGTRAWVECWNATENATISFFVGIHEYAF